MADKKTKPAKVKTKARAPSFNFGANRKKRPTTQRSRDAGYGS
jgi:hypothetical protein